MFFSIPHTRDVKEEDGSSYTTYEVHVNGALHSAVRYSQLHKLNEQLQKRFDTSKLFEFPPKKLFSLSVQDKEERRLMLELYVQSISQCTEVARSNLFVDFLIQSQKEYNKLNTQEPVKLTVYQPDFKEVNVDINGSDYTPDVLTYVARTLGVPEGSHPFFALYLMNGKNKNKSIVRRLQDMECPYLTLKSLDEDHSIEIRRSYWSKSYDEELMRNNVTLHLLYVECIRSLEDRWIKPSGEVLNKLKQLKTAGLKEQFIKVVQDEPMYAHQKLGVGTANYPDEEQGQQDVIIYGGESNLRLLYRDGSCISLPVTRIKCWKLFSEKKDCISLEFLIMKDTLKWIDIMTDATTVILISMVLQSILDEMILLQDGKELELRKIRTNSGYLPISNKDRKQKEVQRPKAPSFSALHNQDNELFMEEIGDDDL